MPSRSKPEQMADLIRRRLVDRARPETQLPPMAALATQFRTSINTVSAALAILERHGVVERRHGSGTYVRQRPTTPQVGILVEHDIFHGRASRYFPQLVRALRAYFQRHGYQANLYFGDVPLGQKPGRVTSEQFRQDLRAGRLAGVITICTERVAELDELVAAAGIPLVADSTDFDANRLAGDEQVVETAVRVLTQQGCRRLALMTWHSVGRAAAWQRAVARHGLKSRPRWLREDLEPELAGAGWEEFREIWTAYPDKPDGLVVLDDVLLSEALLAIQQIGIRVPEQLKLVALTSGGAGTAFPFPLTLLEDTPAEAAELMGAVLLEKITGQRPADARQSVSFRIVPAGPPPERVQVATSHIRANQKESVS